MKCNVCDYRNGDILANNVEITLEQFAAYMKAAQQPEGIIRLGDLPINHGIEGKDDVTVFIE